VAAAVVAVATAATQQQVVFRGRNVETPRGGVRKSGERETKVQRTEKTDLSVHSSSRGELLM